MRRYIILALIASLLITSCQSRFANKNQIVSAREIGKISRGQYTGIAWVSEFTLVLEIDEGDRFENQRACSQQTLNIYEIRTNKLQPLQLPVETDCESYVIRDLQLLPNQQVGYIFVYPKLDSRIIKSINVSTATEKDLYIAPAGNFSLDRFSYSPDMKGLLFVDAPSALMESAIYLFDNNGTPTNITIDFLRADFPKWSSMRSLIAFLGTKPYPGSDDQIKDFSQLEERLDYPWRLYLYDPERFTTRELPLDIVHPSTLKWSPDGKRLAFSGEYQGTPGVWIADNLDNHSNLTVMKVVNGLATFDFSPDGKSIAFAYIGLQKKEKQNVLYMVNLPEQNANVK